MDDKHTILMTVGVALAAGSAVQVIASRLRFPAIALLLLLGVSLGPAGIGVVDPAVLGAGFEPLISLAVAIILFEGGLTLDIEGFRSAPVVIRRLITTGALCTWFGASLLAWLFLGLTAPMALLTGSLIIVTGPTVVTPLLRRLRIDKKLHDILHWEAVLIDPVGVFIALLCFEWVVLSGGAADSRVLAPVGAFGLRIVAGTSLGVAVGFGLATMLRRRLIPTNHVNIFVLSTALFVYGLADLSLAHTGILAVTIAGLVLGWLRPPQLRLLRVFKLEMTELAVAFLFILLAANLDPMRFLELGAGGAAAVAGVMLLVRPFVAWTATRGCDLGWNERAFLAWLAPRGIVAASMASLFAYQLARAGVARAEIVEVFTYAVIAATVLIQGTTAGGVARVLGVRQRERTGWAIVGAGVLGRSLAQVLHTHGVPVILLDRNQAAVEAARGQGLRALAVDALDLSLPDDPRLAEVGQLICTTENPAMNRVLADRWSEVLGEECVSTWSELSLAHEGDRLHEDAHAATRLAVPASIDRALASGELLIRYEEQEDTLPEQVRVLLYVHEGSASRRPRGRGRAQGRVVLEWRPVSDLDLFQRILALDATGPADIPHVYRQLVEAAASIEPSLDCEAALDALAPQANIGSVLLGNGVAIPHLASSPVKRACCVVGVLEQGGWRTGDGAPLRVICLLLSPADSPTEHLEALARIASWASEPDAVEALLQAASDAERLAVLNTYGAEGTTALSISA